MGNEEQQGPPQAGQQPYYGWQYDQEHESAIPPQPPVVQQPQQSPPYFPPVQRGPQPPPPPQYQQPIVDMGRSLGYGQGTEYQFYDVPQPSQPIPELRQARLQQLREERMRRQQQRIGGQDITTLIQRKAAKRSSGIGTPPPAAPQRRPPSWGPGSPPSMLSGAPPAPPAQMSPAMPLPPTEASPIRASSPPPSTLRRDPSAPLIGAGPLPQSAAASAQDTGMIQRVRMGQATMILTGAYIASRFLGLLRTSLFGFVFGTTAISDAYVQAFLIPDTIFTIVAGGALSSAFIPAFVKYMADKKDEKTAWHIASSALNLAIAIMIFLALIAIIFARQLVPLYNPGEPSSQLDLIALLTRIMLLQSIILGGGVIVGAVLQAQQNFLPFAIGTVLYNVGLIAGLIPGVYLAFHGRNNDTLAVYAATWGVVIGAILQVGFQIPNLIKVGMRYSFAFDWRHPEVRQIGRQMLPRIFNAAMLSTTTFVDRYLLSFLAAVASATLLTGLITQYYQAFQLLMLPLGVFGASVSTAAFPTIAEYVARDRMERVRSIILETLRGILFMSIPSSVGLIVLALPIIQVLLEHGRYTLGDAQNTSIVLSFFAIGLAGLASAEILTRSFYALRDSTTPVIVSVAQFIFKIALSLILINAAFFGIQWGMGGLALATSVAGLLEAVVLFWLLYYRIGGLHVRSLLGFIGRVLLASAAMGFCVLAVRLILDAIPFLVTTDPRFSLGVLGTIAAIFKLLVELGVGVLVYIRAARLLKIEELNLGPIKRLLDRFKL